MSVGSTSLKQIRSGKKKKMSHSKFNTWQLQKEPQLVALWFIWFKNLVNHVKIKIRVKLDYHVKVTPKL